MQHISQAADKFVSDLRDRRERLIMDVAKMRLIHQASFQEIEAALDLDRNFINEALVSHRWLMKQNDYRIAFVKLCKVDAHV